MSRPSPAALALAALLVAPALAHGGVTLALQPATTTYGAKVTASGAVVPAVAGVSVAIELGAATAATTTTRADGTFRATFTAGQTGAVTAHDLGDSSVSPAVALTVAPRVAIAVHSVQAFRKGTAVVTVRPASWSGTARLVIAQGTALLGSRSIAFHGGRARISFSPDGYGRLQASAVLSAGSGLAAGTATRTSTSRGRVIGLGARGRDVLALLERLEARGFHTPGRSKTLSREAQDSIMAFHKAYRLRRSWDFQPKDWKLLLRGPRIRPRHSQPAVHIEIDKARQVLLIVHHGRVSAVEHVSTGATGNTPVGRWSILWKAPSTSTWLGSATLYWTMTFHAGFAIHGFAPVPEFPASHGCTREPMWMANWVYRQSPVGETVYVY